MYLIYFILIFHITPQRKEKINTYDAQTLNLDEIKQKEIFIVVDDVAS